MLPPMIPTVILTVITWVPKLIGMIPLLKKIKLSGRYYKYGAVVVVIVIGGYILQQWLIKGKLATIKEELKIEKVYGTQLEGVIKDIEKDREYKAKATQKAINTLNTRTIKAANNVQSTTAKLHTTDLDNEARKNPDGVAISLNVGTSKLFDNFRESTEAFSSREEPP